MNQTEEQYIGYLKYFGSAVESGLLDTRKSADALLGFDAILRFFVVKENPALKDVDFEIPVRIRKGSWEALIPELIDKLFTPEGLLATMGTAYAVAAATKAGTDGLMASGPAKDIKATFRAALRSAQWMIKIATHVGSVTKKKFEKTKFRNNNEEIGIPNDAGELLYVPKMYLEIYMDCPQKLFSKNVKIVEEGRTLSIGIIENQKRDEVSVSVKEKDVFCPDSDTDDILFPELKHGQFVELEGEITRGNEKTNTLGFEYKDHILTCRPEAGNISSFKKKIISQQEGHFFPKVKLIGRINRSYKDEEVMENRPMIDFTDILQIEEDDDNLSLFES